MNDSLLLAADIGGTKTLMALVEGRTGGPRMLAIERYDNDGFGAFEEILRRFVNEQASGRRIAGACLGVAGPREGARIWLTNRPWLIDAEKISAELAGAPVRLLNDFE